MDQTNPPSAEGAAQNVNQESNVLPEMPPSIPSQSLQTPPPPPPRPRPKFKIKKRYILLTVLISFIVVIVTLQELNKKRVEIIDQSPKFNITEAPTPTPEEEPAKQWKSFSALQHGITFKYPVESYLEKSNPFSQDSPVYKAIFRGKRQDEGLITESNLFYA